MSNYPPYQAQPYMPQPGPYMPPQVFQGRPDMQVAQSIPQSQNAAQVQQGPVPGLSPASRPVTSREEAMGVAADFSGSRMLFPDIAHNRIYVKWWDFNRGEPVFQEYVRPAPEQDRPQDAGTAAWASLQDVQDLKDAVDKLQEEVNRLKRPAGKAAGKNDADAK